MKVIVWEKLLCCCCCQHCGLQGKQGRSTEGKHFSWIQSEIFNLHKKPVQAGTHMYTHLHMCTFRRTHADVQNMLNVVTSVELINPHVFRLKQINILISALFQFYRLLKSFQLSPIWSSAFDFSLVRQCKQTMSNKFNKPHPIQLLFQLYKDKRKSETYCHFWKSI